MPEGERTPEPWWTRPMVQVALIGGGILVLAALGVSVPRMLGGAEPEPRTSIADRVVARGERLYTAACAECHGYEGRGYRETGVLAPAIDGSGRSWHRTDAQIVGLLRIGGTQMPAVAAGWSEEDIEAVVTFVKGRWEPEQRQTQVGAIGE